MEEKEISEREKDVGGRPLLFEDETKLEEKINEYFKKCDQRIVKKFSANLGVVEINEPEPYTIAGLAVALDCDPRTINNYEKREQFFPTIKRAKTRIEQDVSRRLMEGNSTGAIFNLKNNFGWKDKMETENKTELSGKIALEVSETAKTTVEEILSDE